MPIPKAEIRREDLIKALSWLRETHPEWEEFDRLVNEGAHGDEEYTMRLNGDDLASFCHNIQTLYTYFDYDRNKEYWEQ